MFWDFVMALNIPPKYPNMTHPPTLVDLKQTTHRQLKRKMGVVFIDRPSSAQVDPNELRRDTNRAIRAILQRTDNRMLVETYVRACTARCLLLLDALRHCVIHGRASSE